MRRSHCLLSAAVLLALAVVGLAAPPRDPAPPAIPEPPAPPPAAAPEAAPPVEITLKRGETLETALRRGGLERAEAAAIVAGLRGQVNLRRLAPGERLSVKPAAPGGAPEITWTRSPAERYEIPSTDGPWTAAAGAAAPRAPGAAAPGRGRHPPPSRRAPRSTSRASPPASPTRVTIRSWAGSVRTSRSTTGRRSAPRCGRSPTGW